MTGAPGAADDRCVATGSASHRGNRVVSLMGLLSDVTPAYGGATWQQAISALLADPFDAMTVQLLRDDLIRDGAFREPVDLEDGCIRNCMHRVVAAVLAGAGTIAVRDGEEPAADPLEEDYPLVEVHFTATIPSALLGGSAGGNGRDEFDVLIGLTRSFPVDDVWVESTLAQHRDGAWEACYYLAEHHQADGIVSALHARAARMGIDLRITGMALRSAAQRDTDL